jgi:hypothetical protein
MEAVYSSKTCSINPKATSEILTADVYHETIDRSSDVIIC